MTTYPIPTGPGLPTVFDVTVEKAKSRGFFVRGRVRYADGCVRHFATIANSPEALHRRELWVDWLAELQNNYENLKA